LGGSLAAITSLLPGPLAGLFDGVHVLPPFPSSGDRGFAPIDYRRIDPAFGGWSDIADLARDDDVMLDLMVNHLARLRCRPHSSVRWCGASSSWCDCARNTRRSRASWR
jgi:sucrose 6(F)-phosphate phosphorylase